MEQRKDRPTVEQLDREIRRRKRSLQTRRVLRSTLYSLLTVAAAAVLVSTLFFPALKIFGNSMVPTLHEGEIVVCRKNSGFRTGDVVAFYYNNKILVKRVICGPGDWFTMKEDGTVIVNGKVLDEPYVTENGFGPCDLELPFQVPDGQFFVMGDQRASSVDSRMSQVGCVTQEQIVGQIVLCIWPLENIGWIEQ